MRFRGFKLILMIGFSLLVDGRKADLSQGVPASSSPIVSGFGALLKDTDTSPMTKRIKAVSSMFGVPDFDYQYWVITNDFQDVLTLPFDATNSTDEHFAKLLSSGGRTFIEENFAQLEVPLQTIKQAMVGVLIREKCQPIHKTLPMSLKEHIVDVSFDLGDAALATIVEEAFGAIKYMRT